MEEIAACIAHQNSWTSAAVAMYGAIRFTGRHELDLIDVMGYTGHAFRINIHPRNVDVAGPTGYPWGPFFAEGLGNLGFRTASVRSANLAPPTAEELTRGLNLIQASLDKGIPVIGWDLFIPEFGLLYGYDDDKKLLHAKDPKMKDGGTLPYEKLGRGEISELFVMSLEEARPFDKASALRGALAMAIHHARQREHQHELPPYMNGLAAYDGWKQAFSSRAVSEFGNAYNTVLVYDARLYAAAFMKRLQQVWDADDELEQDIRQAAFEAERHYARVAESLKVMHTMFPFPQGGSPNDPSESMRAIERLEEAQSAEEQAVLVLERMASLLLALDK
ncbi:hypothetical protein SK3146_05836 [Paenibacillus konkukensis]|uniref:Uncharacterized protein n=1 Tax=Paenibacillus konkukensis TaxID=2020716 RepID=A0ABY4RX16_9BACL|nr:hypothetical protein [Paenibacillus konkukensis]UQZ86543.1 hypothetical protein SK3146_05836 [Paenibacillus konkukensis]